MVAREVDFPPVWLAGFAVAGVLIGRLVPLNAAAIHIGGGILVGAGIVLMLASVAQMVLARTTFLPGRDPRTLVTGGLFRFSRNPIYLGQVMMLAGLYLYWGAAIALPLVALFVRILQNRFIAPEETLLLERFGPAFEEYAQTTRRWI